MDAEENTRLNSSLVSAVARYDTQAVEKALKAAYATGLAPDDLRTSLLHALEHLRQNLGNSKLALPEFLVALDVIDDGLSVITSLKKGKAKAQIPVVIGAVEGDPHDLGKNVIARVYRGAGYRVHDLGKNVPLNAFLQALEDHQAKVLALSAMMSTTMVLMEDIIAAAKARFPNTVVMVGGAPLDAQVAQSFGADGYAESALTSLEETQSALERAKSS